ncbi:MAG: glycerol-3-phosphate 1-O-acyltransferase PlsY [Fimbriimonas sp.]
MNTILISLFIAAYFIGAIPVGVLIARAHGVDIMSFGSGNPGATNVGRALGNKWGGIVFALDVLKGAVPAGVSQLFIREPVLGLPAQLWWFLVGAAAIAGHCLSPFLGFRGGKGIATSLGAGVGSAPMVALPAFALWIVLFKITRYVSLSSLIAVVVAVILSATVPGQAREMVPIFLLLAAFIFYRHRGNIRRLLDGTEPKYESKSKAREANDPDAPPVANN